MADNQPKRKPQRIISDFKRPSGTRPTPSSSETKRPATGTEQALLAEEIIASEQANNHALIDGDKNTVSHQAHQDEQRISKRKLLIRISGLVTIGLILVALVIGGYFWMTYKSSLGAVDPSSQDVVKFEIAEGVSLAEVADQLEGRDLIKKSWVFQWYANSEGKQYMIQAGACSLSRSETVPEILDKLTSGCHDFRVLTIFPGATIEPSLYARTAAEKSSREFVDRSVRASLEKAGYSASEINSALNASYSGKLFQSKPKGSSLEGYMFGETYYIDTDMTAKQALEHVFSHMERVISEDKLIEGYKQQELNLFQGITLASIVERELDCEAAPEGEVKDGCYQDQRKIAQVFLKRLRSDQPLGSDVTFIYAADKLGVQPEINIKSPYNTRVVKGLPPGPIATPGELAMRAVADPSDSDYLYFLAGDDGIMYFAKTLPQHETNIEKHCAIGCSGL